MRNKFNLLLVLFLCAGFFISSGVSWAETYSSTTAGTHAITASGTTETYTNPTVTKTGDVSGQSDDYDWKGTNAAVWAGDGAVLTITGGTINSSAKYGNAVFSYGGTNSNTNNNQGDGTTVNISGTTITTTSNNSGGIMTTGGGIMNASNLTIKTSGGSSAAIRSDSGGGTVTVEGGTYETSGTGSPAIYSTAAITVTDADLTATNSQGVVIEGGNSVTLTTCKITANHATKNSQDTTRQAVLLYKSMSKDASSGTSAFTMKNGSITNTTGDIFCVTNTTSTISLTGVTITNNDSDGYFLRAAGQSWGTSGSNGGTVTLTASSQTITGDFYVDASSSLTMNLTGSSTLKGAINTSLTTSGGTVNVTVASGSTWTLTGTSYVSSLTNNGTINRTNTSYKLYVNGTEYTNITETTDTTDNDTTSDNTTTDDNSTTTDNDTTEDNTTTNDTTNDTTTEKTTDETTEENTTTDDTTTNNNTTTEDTTNNNTNNNSTGGTTTTQSSTSTAPEATVVTQVNQTATKTSIINAIKAVFPALPSGVGDTILTDITTSSATYSSSKVASYVPSTETNPITLESWSGTAEGVYLRKITRDSNINALATAGSKVFIRMLLTSDVTASGASEVKPAETASQSTGVFVDSSGNVITAIPTTGDVYTSVYMKANTTYTPLITSEKTTTSTTGDSSSNIPASLNSSGCNFGMGISAFALLFLLKNKNRF